MINSVRRLAPVALATVCSLGFCGCGFETPKTAALPTEPLKVVLPENPTAQEKQLGKFLEKAIQTTNINALVAAQHFGTNEGIRDIYRDLSERFYRDMLSDSCTKVVIERTDPETGTERTEENGDRIRESLPVRWMIRVTQKRDKWNNFTYILRAGVESNRVLFTQSEIVK